MESVVTRFAPSPTGALHLGGARTALFCYLFARKHQGKFILRIEDTDRERSRKEYVDEILAALQWLGLQWDDEPVYQSQRTDLYQQAAQRLIDSGNAYRCTCTIDELEAMREEQKKLGENPKYDGRHRQSNLGADIERFVIRFKNPQVGEVSFADLVQGDVHVGNDELDDMVIMRMDGSPTYNFCAVVDDIAMGITHVVRGDDHLRNSLRQCNLYDAMEVQRPKFAHLPLILNSSGARLSKREGAYNILDYQARGILPEALGNYMARLGWSHKDQEIFTSAELVELFDLKSIQKSPAQYDEQKMLWVNHNYIKNQTNADLCPILLSLLDKQQVDISNDKVPLEAIIGLHKERCEDMNKLAEELICYYKEPTYDSYNKEELAEYLTARTMPALNKLNEGLQGLEQWDAASIKDLIKQLVAQDADIKFPDIAMPLRLAITGTTSSPSIDKVAELLGKDESLARFARMLQQA